MLWQRVDSNGLRTPTTDDSVCEKAGNLIYFLLCGGPLLYIPWRAKDMYFRKSYKTRFKESCCVGGFFYTKRAQKIVVSSVDIDRYPFHDYLRMKLKIRCYFAHRPNSESLKMAVFSGKNIVQVVLVLRPTKPAKRTAGEAEAALTVHWRRIFRENSKQ